MALPREPAACFLGALHGRRLASAYTSGDVMVFPSRTDTFGLIMIEALVSRTPVAAFRLPRPLDVIGSLNGVVRALDDDLGQTIERAVTLSRAACVATARRSSWESSADQFIAGLAPLPIGAGSGRIAARSQYGPERNAIPACP